ncbi:MAG: hypothetical protein P8Y36_09935, partial [Alphaproteobacteria bacterium]
MAEFYAWAVTGVVTEYMTWSNNNGERNASSLAKGGASTRRDSQATQMHEFILRGNDGRTTEVYFSSSELAFR